MGSRKAFRIGIDPIIALGRAVLGTFGLVAIWLDPSQPTSSQDLTYGLLSGYTLYAYLILFLVYIRPMPSEAMALLTHCIDLTAFSAVMYLTEGPTSPFFVFFTFALLAATLRWSWRGALWTAVFSLLILALMGFSAWSVVDEPEFTRLVIRSVYLTVAGLLLAFLGAHQEQVRSKLAELAASPPTLVGDSARPIAEAVQFAAGVFGLRRVLLAWSEEEEPWQQLALWTDGRLEETSEAPDRYDPLVAPELEHAGFFSLDATDADSTVAHKGGGRFRRMSGVPIHAGLCQQFKIGRVVSVPINAEGLDGRLFLLDGPGFNADDVQVAELAGARIATLFDQHRLLQDLRTAAAGETRLKVARDIHDGILQFLAGTGLHLKSAATLIPTDPERAVRRLAELQQALIAEQTDLRALVDTLRDRRAAPATPPAPDLLPWLGHLTWRLKQQWGIAIRWSVEPPDANLDATMIYELGQMIAEAVANAHRHGQASEMEIDLRLDNGMVSLSVADNGKGFPFWGRYDLSVLQSRGLGPRSLRERVAACHGLLTLDSGDSGARLEIKLPLAPTSST